MPEADDPQARSRAGVVVVALAVGLYAASGAQATSSLASGDPWDWAETLFRWALYAVLGGAVLGFTHSGVFGSPEQRARRAELRAALRTGELPAGADPDAWRPRLTAEAREFRQAGWAVLVLSQVVAVLVAAAAVVPNDSAPRVWALAVALSLFVVVPLRWCTGRLRRIRALQSGTIA